MTVSIYNTTYSTVSQKKVILMEMALTPLKSFISLKLGPQIGQVSTSADRHTLNRFQSVGTYFNIWIIPHNYTHQKMNKEGI